MKEYLKAFKYFFFVQNFFKTKKIYFIFFLYTLVTIVEILNIGIILPFLNLIFNPEKIDLNNYGLLNYLNIQNISIDQKFIYISMIIIIILFIIKSLILVLAANMQANFFAMMRTKITTYFFDLYLSKSYIYYLNEKDTSKIMRNVTMLSSSYSGFLERFLLLANDFFVFLGVIIILFIYDPFISSFVFVTLFVSSVLFTFITKKYFFNLGKSLLSLSSDLLKDIQESLDNILQIKLLKKTDFFKNQFNFKAVDSSNKIGKLTFLQSLPKIFIEMIAVILLFSIIFYLIYNEKSQDEILIMLTLFAVATMRIIPLSNKLISFLNTYSAFVPSLELLYQELNKNDKQYSSQKEIKNFLKIETIDKIELKNISFGYSDRKNLILENINFNFYKNKIYGLVGETGSGKTTLLNIITGLIKPIKGDVKYNGYSIDDKTDKKISYVSQNTYLQNSSLKNNVAFGCTEKEIDKKKISDSLEKASLKYLVQNLSEGIDTNISELGANFSGGQIQRLSIARALYADSELIIFDEPTSSLDLKTKNEILDMISELRENRIIILISHTNDDLSICDKILKIENKNVMLLND